MKTKEDFPAALTKHFGSATGHFTKLEGFCKGPYMCGAAPQSGDFHVFKMFDQHVLMSTETGLAFDVSKFPKLKALHATMKAEPALASYFASDMYAKWAVNNPMATHFTGNAYTKAYTAFGPTLEEVITP